MGKNSTVFFLVPALLYAGISWGFSVTASQTWVRCGESTALHVEGVPDGGEGWSYVWTAERGSIDGSNDEVQYTAPNSPGWDTVSMAISYEGTLVETCHAVLLVYHQFAILKADDLVRDAVYPTPVPTNWKYFFDYVTGEKKLKTSVGVLGMHLDPILFNGYQHAEFVAYLKSLHNTGYVEFWNHGYDHSGDATTSEFFGQPLGFQRFHLALTQGLFESQLGFQSRTFGAPFNKSDINTVTAVNEHPELKVWLFGPPFGSHCLVLSPGGAYLEIAGGVPNFDFFLHGAPDGPFYFGYSEYPRVVVLQCHPGYDPFRTNFAEFEQIIDYLIEHNVTFITAIEYQELVTDGAFPLCPEEDYDEDGLADMVDGQADPDADGLPSFADVDSDNDGISDEDEGVGDADQDGIPDYLDPDGEIPPSIVLNPQGGTISPGDPYTFLVVAVGSAPLQYQWRKDGEDIADATTSAYTIDSAVPEDAGTYECAVTNAYGTMVSAGAALDVRQQLIGSIGDVDKDGVTGDWDIMLIQYIEIFGEETLNSYLIEHGMQPADSRLADIDLDGHINVWDATLVYYTNKYGLAVLNNYLTSQGLPQAHTGEQVWE